MQHTIIGQPDMARMGVGVFRWKKNIQSTLTNDHGAAAVEFALALIAFFLFFGIYMQCVQLIVEHGKLTFNGFVTARTFDVKGKIPAWNAGQSIDSETSIDFAANGSSINVSKPILIPKILRPLFTKRIIFIAGYPYPILDKHYTLKHKSPVFDEQALLSTLQGDN